MRTQDDDIPEAPARRKRGSAAANVTDLSLPEDVKEGYIWKGVVIPTIIRWAGCQHTVWELSDDALLEVIRVTCKHHFNRTDLNLSSAKCEAVKLVSPGLYHFNRY